jgi:O-antigen/teichoic acid export membrane protein
MLKKIFFHSVLYSLPSISLQLISLLILPLITPFLTAADYGVYGIILAYISFIAPLKDLGFSIVFVNTYFRYPKRWPIIWQALYGHLIIWSFLYLLIFFGLVIIAVPESEYHNLPMILFLTLVPGVILDSANAIGNYYYRLKEKPAIIATIGVLSGIFGIVVMYYCIVIQKMGYMGWFFGTFATSLLIFVSYFYPVFIKRKLFPVIRLRKDFISRYLKVSLPMIPHNYSSYLLNSSDRVVMDWYKIDMKQVGLYNMAYRFGNAFEMMGEAIGMAVAPQYVKLYLTRQKTDLETARQLTFILMAVFLLLGFNGSLWLKEVFALLIRNKALAASYSIGIIILMGYCYRPMYWATINKLTAFEKTGVIWKITFGAGVLNVLLNLIFLQKYGIMAAAVATFVSLLVIGFAGFWVKSYRGLNNLPHYPLFWIASIIVATVLSYIFKDIAIWMKFIISFISLLIIAYFAKIIFSKIKAGANG